MDEGKHTTGPRGERLVFVGGSPRSGTTLLQNMLDSHPDITGGPEFHLLPQIIEVRNELQRYLAQGRLEDYCSPETADRLTASFIESLLLPLADRENTRLLAEKTPKNALAFAELLHIFPGARCIQTIRDPRAIIASLLGVGARARRRNWRRQAHTTELRAAIVYVRHYFKAQFAAAELDRARVLTVTYENLVCRPEDTTREITEFLGLDWDVAMTRPGRIRHPGERDIIDGVWYDAASYQRDPETKELDKWRRELSILAQATISVAFEDLEPLRNLGYDLSLNGLPTWAGGYAGALRRGRRLQIRAKIPLRSLRGGAQRLAKS